jgi:predicted glutamine amidotransferase
MSGAPTLRTSLCNTAFCTWWRSWIGPRAIAEQIRSGLFLAHIGASTGRSTARQNYHPFCHAEWLFMHNGQIGGYSAIRRQLEMLIVPEF